MAEWLYENGIGEARAALVVDGRIVEAAIEPDDAGPRAGAIVAARLTSVLVPRLRALATLDGGGEAIVDSPPRGVSEGAPMLLVITREAIPEEGRPKLAKAVAAPPGSLPQPGQGLRARIAASGHQVRTMHPHEPDLLEAAGWSELLDEALRGEIDFPGGRLRLSITPAMTLFDVDGALPPAELARAGAAAAGEAIRRMGISGSIGIDLPTLAGKAARQAAAAAFDAALPQPFERTAVNGFGFLQLVRRRVRPSLPELLRADPAGAAARALLRRIERDPGQPAAASPAIRAKLEARPDWTALLVRRTGRPISLMSQPE